MQKMMYRRLALFACLTFLLPCFAQQSNTDENVFTISVAAPVSPKDVQVRYFLTGSSEIRQSSTIAANDENKILIKTGQEGKVAKGFKAILYAPDCQFATISIDDLAASSRQAEFQCTKLPQIELRGKTTTPDAGQKSLHVEALYECSWAKQFFGLSEVSISPFFLTKTSVGSDGTFVATLPDFSADPLWSTLSNEAALMFFLADSHGARQVLKSPEDLSRKGLLKVAPSYPDIEFTVRPEDLGAFRSQE
ncbi:MAG TPA: hypothetical protein VKZ53_28215 [Candidatus Angelobacter sp.]|nr:hypothetical protein [Candidatus Angelobacter sp.]